MLDEVKLAPRKPRILYNIAEGMAEVFRLSELAAEFVRDARLKLLNEAIFSEWFERFHAESRVSHYLHYEDPLRKFPLVKELYENGYLDLLTVVVNHHAITATDFRQLFLDQSLEHGITVLWLAVLDSKLVEVERLLRFGANPVVVTQFGMTPLSVVANCIAFSQTYTNEVIDCEMSNMQQTMRLMLHACEKFKFDINANNFDANDYDRLRISNSPSRFSSCGYETALSSAVWRLHTLPEKVKVQGPIIKAMIDMLHKAGARIDAVVNDNTGDTALHYIALHYALCSRVDKKRVFHASILNLFGVHLLTLVKKLFGHLKIDKAYLPSEKMDPLRESSACMVIFLQILQLRAHNENTFKLHMQNIPKLFRFCEEKFACDFKAICNNDGLSVFDIMQHSALKELLETTEDERQYGAASALMALSSSVNQNRASFMSKKPGYATNEALDLPPPPTYFTP